jgi:hypothetical protein
MRIMCPMMMMMTFKETAREIREDMKRESSSSRMTSSMRFHETERDATTRTKQKEGAEGQQQRETLFLARMT